jgi:hypothetical protein
LIDEVRSDEDIARVYAYLLRRRTNPAALRKALGDGRARTRYIANVPTRGYSFVAPVTREQWQPINSPPNGVAVSGNLPAPLTRIVGRDDIIAALAAQLAQRRFLTIVDPGGIGKTHGSDRSRRNRERVL